MGLSDKWWQNLLRQNWQLKLLALLLAALTYYAIRGATGYEVEYAVPVTVDVEPGVAVLAKNPDQVQVRFRGSQDDLLKLDQKRLQALVKVREESLGGHPRPVPITERDIEGASGVAVVMVDPPEVMITFDREVEATFSVARPATVGEPLLGKAEIQFSPQTVTIRGPKTRIAELVAEGHDQVNADPVEVDGRVESFTKRVQVHPPGGNWASRIEPDAVTVQVNIIKKSTTRAWEQLLVRAIRDGEDTKRLVIDPPTVEISLEGRSELLENVSEHDLRVFVDCAGLNTAVTNEVPVQVHLPVYMDVSVTVVPKTVQVWFEP
jgi:YbbR domain-containing protein